MPNTPAVPVEKLITKIAPTKAAARTAKTARTMAKCLIRIYGKAAVQWRLIEFGGITGTESRGIVDILAIRKDHHEYLPKFKRGDLFEMVLVQVKGGSAAWPKPADRARLRAVKKYYNAKAIVLAEWRLQERWHLHVLEGDEWRQIDPSEVFG